MFSEMVKDIYEGELDTIVKSGSFWGDINTIKYLKCLYINIII